MTLSRRSLGLGLLALPALRRPARAETETIRLGKQYGLPFLPQMVMESRRLIEKHAEAGGHPGLNVQWASMSGPGALNEALLSGSMEFVNVATPALATLWERTRQTSRPVKALCTVQSMPYVLMSRRPEVHSVADLGPEDRVAVPTVKISLQAMMLEMAAAKQWGMAQYRPARPAHRQPRPSRRAGGDAVRQIGDHDAFLRRPVPMVRAGRRHAPDPEDLRHARRTAHQRHPGDDGGVSPGQPGRLPRRVRGAQRSQRIHQQRPARGGGHLPHAVRRPSRQRSRTWSR